MKKILLVTQGFPLGNSERGFLESEYEELKKRSELYILALTDINNTLSDDHVYTFSNYKPTIAEMLTQFMHKEVVADIVKAKKECNFVKFLMRLRRILSYSAHAVHIEHSLEPLIREKNIDIVYTYWCLPATVAAVRLKKKYDIKVVTRFHGFDLYQYREKYGWQPLRSFLSECADKLIFACEAGIEYYSKEFGNFRNKGIVSYLGTKEIQPIAKRNPRDTGTLKIVSCSNVIPLKRVDMIARCMQLASPNIELEWHHVGGPAKAYDFLENCNVTYVAHGEVPHDEVINIFRETCPDIFITLSVSEGLAVSVQESLSMGIPVITTDVGGASEIVQNGFNGYLLPVDVCEQTVADILVSFSQLSESERKRYSENALEMWKQKCDACTNAKKFVEELLSL